MTTSPEQEAIGKEQLRKLEEVSGYQDPKAKSLPVFLPSHDKRSMLQTIQTVNNVSLFLGRPIFSNTCGGLGQAVAMNGLVQSFKGACKRISEYSNLIDERGVARGLWVEDDIELITGQAEEIAAMIVEADKHGWNIVAPYTTGYRDDGELNWVYFKKPEGDQIGRPYTEEEIVALQPYEAVDLAGLGFYYGDIYTDYVWHEGSYNGTDRFGLPSYAGIDWNYFLDNRIQLRHYPIVIMHEKPMSLGNIKVIANWGPGSTVPKMLRPVFKRPAIGSPEDKA